MFINNFKDWLILVLVLTIFSCSNGNSSSEDDILSFTAVDSLEIELPEEFLQFTSWSTYNREDQQILVEYGLGSNNSLFIHQVDFLSGEYLEPLVIPQQGPNGYNSSDASVYFKNRDSLFVFPATAPHFYLYSRSGELLEKYVYNATDNSKYNVSGYYSNAVFLDEKIFIPTAQFIRFDDPQIFTKSTPVRSFDFNSNQFIDSIPYPSYTIDKSITVDRLSPTIAAINQDSLVINYRFSDSIYFWNPITSNVQLVFKLR